MENRIQDTNEGKQKGKKGKTKKPLFRTRT